MLIVDDEEEIAESLRSLLAVDLPRQDIALTTCPEAALRALQESAPALVLADYRMPAMDGMRFLDEVRRRCPDAVLYLITAWKDAKMERQAGERGIRILEKPFDVAELRRVAQAVQRRLGSGAHA